MPDIAADLIVLQQYVTAADPVAFEQAADSLGYGMTQTSATDLLLVAQRDPTRRAQIATMISEILSMLPMPETIDTFQQGPVVNTPATYAEGAGIVGGAIGETVGGTLRAAGNAIAQSAGGLAEGLGLPTDWIDRIKRMGMSVIVIVALILFLAFILLREWKT